MIDSQVAVVGGREIAYTEIGQPDGASVIFCHGAPMSRLHLVGLDEPFAARGLRVISPDRPGYGRSTPQPGRSLIDWPADVAALADALGIDRFIVAGHSSGGAYAVACAALLTGRVTAAVVLAGVTDMAWPDAWSGYLEGRKEVPLMRLSDERAVIAGCIEQFGADGRGFLAEPFDLPAPDTALLADDASAEAFGMALTEAFRQGVTAYAQDICLEGRGWPFDPGRVIAPTDVVHGSADTLLPVAHSRHTAAVIPGSALRILQGHGHLSIVSELPALASALVRSVA